MIQPETNTHRRSPFSSKQATPSPNPSSVVGEARMASPSPTRRAAVQLDDELRELSGFEEELFEDRRLARNSAALCNELLARCLVPAGRDPGSLRERIASLTVAERDLALVALRRISLGDQLELHADCPSCSEVNEIEFDLALLPTTLAQIPERVVATLGDGRTVVLRLPTAGDQAELLAMGIEGAARRLSWLLARVLVELGEAKGPFEIEAIHELATTTRRELEQLLSSALPEFELGIEVKCAACEKSFISPFSIDSFFLLS